MNVVHITEVGIKPESVAFVSYVMNQYVNVPYTELVFLEVDEPFLKARAKYVSKFRSTNGSGSIEFWIIEAQGELSGMAVRFVENGMVNQDNTSFINFVMRPYHQACVVEAINELPIDGQAKH